MLLKDSFTVQAPVEAMWLILNDVQRISTCVPGVEGVTQTEPDAYQGTLKVKVGPINAAFQGTVRIVERAPQQRIAAEVEGQDKSSASLVKATFAGALSPTETGTRVDYELNVALRGRLAQFGLAVVQGVAKKLTVSFAECLQAMIAAESRP